MAPFVVKEHQSEPRESFVANPVAERFAAGVIARYLTFQAGSARARRRSMSKPPPGAGARVGQVGAVRAGADGAVEMLVELGLVGSRQRGAAHLVRRLHMRLHGIELADRGVGVIFVGL